MYKVQPYNDQSGKERYHLLDCNNDFTIVSEAEKFFTYAEMINLAPNTIRAYAYDLLLFYNFCQSAGINPLLLGNNKHIMDTFMGFTTYLINHKDSTGNLISITEPARADTTINRIMSTVYTFYRFLSRDGICQMPAIFTTHISRQRSFLAELTKSKVRNYPLFRRKTGKHGIRYITREQYNALLDACRTLRDKIIISLLFEAGMRSGEVCGIHIEDLQDIDHGILKIVPRENNENNARVKNHASGSILLPKYVVDMIIDYISVRTDSSPFLLTVTKGYKAGSPISKRTIATLFNELSKRTGISAHAHMLRHGFAVEKIEEDWELYEVQSYLRHRVPTSTEIYAEFTDRAKTKRMHEFYQSHDIEEGEYDYVITDTNNTNT